MVALRLPSCSADKPLSRDECDLIPGGYTGRRIACGPLVVWVCERNQYFARQRVFDPSPVPPPTPTHNAVPLVRLPEFLVVFEGCSFGAVHLAAPEQLRRRSLHATLSEPLHGEEVQVAQFASSFSRRFAPTWRNSLGPERPPHLTRSPISALCRHSWYPQRQAASGLGQTGPSDAFCTRAISFNQTSGPAPPQFGGETGHSRRLPHRGATAAFDDAARPARGWSLHLTHRPLRTLACRSSLAIPQAFLPSSAGRRG